MFYYKLTSNTTLQPLILSLIIIFATISNQQNQPPSSGLPFLLQPPWQKRLFLTKDLNNTSKALQCILQRDNKQLFCFKASDSTVASPIPIPLTNNIVDIQTDDDYEHSLFILTSTCLVHIIFDTSASTDDGIPSNLNHNILVLAGMCSTTTSISQERTGPTLYSRFSSLIAFSVARYTEAVYQQQDYYYRREKHILYKIFIDTNTRPSKNVLFIANDAWVREIPDTELPLATAVSLAVVSPSSTINPIVPMAFAVQHSPTNLTMFYTFSSLSSSNTPQLDPTKIDWNQLHLDLQVLFSNNTVEVSTFRIVSVGESFFQLWIATKKAYIVQIQFMQKDLKNWTESSSTSSFWKSHANILMFEIPYTIHSIQWNGLYGLMGYNYEDENRYMLIADTDFKSNVQDMFYDTIFCTATNNRLQNFNKCMQGYIQIDPRTCIPCPIGGYAHLSNFVPCPKGTHNNKTGATNMMACIPCPIMSIAPKQGSALCTTCNLTHPFQSFDGTECLDQCPSHHQKTILQGRKKCSACPNNMMADDAGQQCIPCPNNMVSSNGNPCELCPLDSVMTPNQLTSNPTTAFCAKHCDSNSCSPDGKSECTIWNPGPIVDTIYYDFKFETRSAPPLDVWLSTNEITALVSFRNGSILVFTLEPFLLVEVQFTTTVTRPQIQILSLSQHKSFFPIPIKTIQATVMSRDETQIYAADPSTGIIIKISNWDMKNPSQSFEYRMINNSHSPISLAIPPPLTISNISNSPLPELYFISLLDSCYHAIEKNQNEEVETTYVQSYLLPSTTTENVTRLWHITSTDTRPNTLYFLANIIIIQSTIVDTTTTPGIIALNLVKESVEIISFLPTAVQWYTRPRMFYYQENSNQTFVIALNHTIILSTTNMKLEAGHFGETGYIDDEGKNARMSEILAMSPIQTAEPNSELSSFIFADRNTPALLHLRILFYRPCECLVDFFYASSIKACVPCQQGLHSMTGARQCTSCQSGYYREKGTTQCIPCPLHLWWWSITDDWDEINACRRMQSALVSPTSEPSLKLISFREIQYQLNTRQFNTLFPSEIQSSDLLWKIITVLPTTTKLNLLESDNTGYFWSYKKPLFLPPPTNNKTQSIFHIPGIWTPCLSSPSINDMRLLQTCECTHPGILNLTFLLGNPWDSYRWKFANDNNVSSMSSLLPLYAFRLHTNPMHNTPLVLLLHKANLTTNYTTTDTGTCWMGWPTSYNCTSPTHAWVFPNEEYPTGACVQCPNGTFAPLPSSIRCVPSSVSLSDVCTAGTYVKPLNQNGDEGIICEPCPPGTYSSMVHVSECTRKTTKCPTGYYVQETSSILSSQDNECILCEPCNTITHIMYPYSNWATIYARCNGRINYKPFICISKQDSIKGYSATILRNSISSLFKYDVWYYPCLDDSAIKNNLYEWQTGPFPDLCYIQCKYGINTNAAWNYYKSFQLLAGDVWASKWSLKTVPENEEWQQNLFPMVNPIRTLNTQSTTFLLLRSLMKSVCTTCDLSPCPELMWRPIYPYMNGCGAPCMINPTLCAPNRTDGCVFLCDIPDNAYFLSYFKENSTCTWQCKDGWFLDDTKTRCLDCSPVHCVQGTSYIGTAKCKPTMTLSNICPGCPSSPEALPPGLNLSVVQNQPGICLYECYKEGTVFYKNPDPFTNLTKPCISCESPLEYNTNNKSNHVIVCPQGYMPKCGLEPCGQCPSLLTQFSEHSIPSFSYVMSRNVSKTCRVMCNPNYNTMDSTTFQILPAISDDGYDPQTIMCQPCTNSIDFPCDPFLLQCPPGQTLITASNPEKCETCKNSLDLNCPTGTQAPPCPGGRITQIDLCMECLRMQNLVSKNDEPSPSTTLVWPVRFFVPYEDAWSTGFKRRGQDNTGVMVIYYNNSNDDTPVTNNKYYEMSIFTLLQLNPNGSLITCPFACISGMIFVNGSCIACSSLYPSNLIPGHYPYDTYYSLWNASVGTRWWPEQYDPTHLGFRFYNPSTGELALETRSGKCWPCPKTDNNIFKTNYVYNSGEHDLCNAIKYSNPQQEPTTTTTTKIRTVTQSLEGLFAKNTVQSKLFIQVNTQNQRLTRRPRLISIASRRRRLLSVMDSSWYYNSNNNNDSFFPITLDTNTEYEHNISFLIAMAKRLRWLQSNSSQTNMIQNNSLIIQTCPTEKGYYRAPPMGYWCDPCPENHYCPSILNIIPCPAFSTTQSKRGASQEADCTCIQGFTTTRHKNTKELVCIPSIFVHSNGILSDKDWYYTMKVWRYCQPGYFYDHTNAKIMCLPCPPGTFEKNEICHPCPPYSTSIHAQTHCMCTTESPLPHHIEFHYHTSTHYWSEQSLTACHNNEKKECPLDWRHKVTGKCMQEQYEHCSHAMNNAVYDPITESCLCPPGMMMDFFSSKCVLCPKGSYSPTFGVSPCIQCPSSMPHTQNEGSTMYSQCEQNQT